MPPQKNRRLTPEDHQLIRAYRQAGTAVREIAQELGCSADQVYSYLGTLSPPIEPAAQVELLRGQHALIRYFKLSELRVQEIAARLGIEVAVAALELAGRKAMSTKRIGMVRALLLEKNKKSLSDESAIF